MLCTRKRNIRIYSSHDRVRAHLSIYQDESLPKIHCEIRSIVKSFPRVRHKNEFQAGI